MKFRLPPLGRANLVFGCVLSLTVFSATALAAESPAVVTPAVSAPDAARATTAAAVTAASPVRPNTAILPVPQRAEDRMPANAIANFNTRHAGYVERAKKGEIDLLFLGDSITQNWSTRGKEVWEKYYAPMKAAFFGVGSDRTQHLLWRLQNGEGEGFSPKAIVVMIGTNNIGANTPPEIAVGIGAVVHELRTRFACAKILLLGIFPRGAKDSGPRQRVAEVNQLIAALHDGQHVFFLDLADKFIAPDGEMRPGLYADNPPLHPNGEGHAVWAEAIKEPLAELMK